MPIICTGNDFSTLYAPLIRDGRMEKFYWNPTREDRIGITTGIFADDGLTQEEVIQLVDTYPGWFLAAGRLQHYVFHNEIVCSLGNSVRAWH